MYFRSLQVFRGIAAVAVVLYHVNCNMDSILRAPWTIFRVFDTTFSMGAWFFFSLSGFLMAYMIDTSRDQFLRRRLIRIYPTFWVAVGITLLGKVVLFDRVASPRLVRAASLLPFSGKAAYPLGVEWTLIYEVFFYLVCALFAATALHRRFPVFLACWAGAIAIAKLGYGHPTPLLPGPGLIVFSLFNLLFIMGGLGYHVYKRLEPTPRVRGLLLAGVCSGIVIYSLRNGRELMGFFGLGLSFTAAIVWGALGDRRNRPVPSGSFFEKLGDASYGLYLIHVPIMSCFFFLWAERVGLKHPTTCGLIGAVLALVGGWWFGRLDVALQKRLKNRFIRARSSGPESTIPRPRLWRRLARNRRTAGAPAS